MKGGGLEYSVNGTETKPKPLAEVNNIPVE
jgi:hypothetical protein